MVNTAGIDGNRPAERLRRSSARAAAAGGFAQLVESASTVAAAGVGTVAGLAGLDALLGVQEVGDDEGERRRANCRYGDDLLDRLETLRRQMLSAAVDLDDLQALAQTVRAAPRRSGDGRLDAVIADIELRVEVEIAKLAATD